MQYRSGERNLDEANTTSSTAFTPPGSCLVDNATHLSATRDVVEREATQLSTAACLPRSHGELPFCSYKLSMRVYL